MRHVITVLCLILCFIVDTAAVSAASAISIEIDGFIIAETDAAPENIQGRVFVPLRLISESLGYTVDWDPANKIVSVAGMFSHTVGNTFAQLADGSIKDAGVASYIKNGRTMVSIRLIAESLGCDVEWDGKQNKVVIRTDGSTIIIHEYGDDSVLVGQDGRLQAYISFPVTGITLVDAQIQAWANAFYDNAWQEVETAAQTDPNAQGEINFQYNSYIVNGRYVGIQEIGFYSNSAMANPMMPYKLFNIDLKTQRMLSIDKILDLNQTELILKLLRQKLSSSFPELAEGLEVDAAWLSQIVLTHGGIEVCLDKSVYLPSYIGSVRVALSREELGTAFLLPITRLATPTPTPKPTAAPGKAPSQLDTSKPMIALTFDDGPSVYTTRILNLLSKYNSRATFFEVGNRMAGKADVMKAIVASGSEIAGHSWDHRQLTKLSVNEIRDEMTSAAATIKKYTGVNATLVRPPYGAYNDTVKKIAKDLGLVLVNWSVDTLDWKNRDANKVYDATMKYAKRGAIVLYHDLYESTAVAMERVIPKLVNDGYQLVTVSELMGKMNPGQVYTGKK